MAFFIASHRTKQSLHRNSPFLPISMPSFVLIYSEWSLAIVGEFTGKMAAEINIGRCGKD